MKRKKSTDLCSFLLSPQDSNLDRQNQNLQCCHYTRGQFPGLQNYKNYTDVQIRDRPLY